MSKSIGSQANQKLRNHYFIKVLTQYAIIQECARPVIMSCFMVQVALSVGKQSGILPIVLVPIRYGEQLRVEITDSRLRQRQKLERVRTKMGIDVDILIADSQDWTHID